MSESERHQLSHRAEQSMIRVRGMTGFLSQNFLVFRWQEKQCWHSLPSESKPAAMEAVSTTDRPTLSSLGCGDKPAPLWNGSPLNRRQEDWCDRMCLQCAVLWMRAGREGWGAAGNVRQIENSFLAGVGFLSLVPTNVFGFLSLGPDGCLPIHFTSLSFWAEWKEEPVV